MVANRRAARIKAERVAIVATPPVAPSRRVAGRAGPLAPSHPHWPCRCRYGEAVEAEAIIEVPKQHGVMLERDIGSSDGLR